MSTLEATPESPLAGRTEPGKSRRQLLGCGFGALLAATGLWLGHGNANADPHTHDMYLVCEEIASNPTIYGVDKVALSWIDQLGNSPASAQLGAATIWDAVTYTCPEYRVVVLQWAATRNHPEPITQGGMTA